MKSNASEVIGAREHRVGSCVLRIDFDRALRAVDHLADVGRGVCRNVGQTLQVRVMRICIRRSRDAPAGRAKQTDLQHLCNPRGDLVLYLENARPLG